MNAHIKEQEVQKMQHLKKQNLLVELFVEELPPKALSKLGDAFSTVLFEQLKAQGLLSESAAPTSYATPRRLAVHVTHVLEQAPDQQVMRKLMPVKVGLDEQGQPTAALLKKLASLGADASAVTSLKRENDGKAEILFYDNMVKGVRLAEGLQQALDTAIAKLPIPKVMGYQLGDGWTTVHFVRPVHGIIALHGADIVPVAALGLSAARVTHGHRFEAKTDPIEIRHADDYEQQLKNDGAVIASFTERKNAIQRQLSDVAGRVGGAVRPIADEALLEEVTALVEQPNVLICEFEPEFLQVPQECLILTMKANQKYFPLLDDTGKLTNQFLIVSNISPADASAVIGGNERVVRPRLADAKFFYDQDRKRTLESRMPSYANVVYHNKLGTLAERVERIRAIAKLVTTMLGNPELLDAVDTAARLAKADLFTDMVGEFPELQGIMGRYYALNDGLAQNIADAIEDHYKPRFAGDTLPRGRVGLIVALADKLETLTGMFAIGNTPTGDKDPFALRRHALGVIRMLMEEKLPLHLDALLENTCAEFHAHLPQSVGAIAWQNPHTLIADFIYDRLAVMLREQGYTAQEVDAVMALRPQLLDDVVMRLEAVRAFASLPEAPALAAANKRVGNILKKTTEQVKAKINPQLLQEPAEQALEAALRQAQAESDVAYDSGNYTVSLKALAALKQPVDAFFDQVMVNVEDNALRSNRLGLLALMHQIMNRVADLSRLA